MVVQSCCVKHLVVVAISKAARADAARAGHPSPAVVIHEVEAARTELVGKLLDMGGSVDEEGRVTLTYGIERRNNDWSVAWNARHLERRPSDAAEAIKLVTDDLAAEQADKLAELVRDASRAIDERRPSVYDRQRAAETIEKIRKIAPTHPNIAPVEHWLAHHKRIETTAQAEALAKRASDLAAWLADTTKRGDPIGRDTTGLADDLVERVRAEIKRRTEADGLAEAQAEGRRLERLAALARKYGDENAIARLDAEDGEEPLGLLPEDEAMEIVAEAMLPKMLGDTVVDYQHVKLTKDDTLDACAEAGCKRDGDCKASWTVESCPAIDGVTSGEWTALVAIREALTARSLPLGTLRLHFGSCECRDVPKDAARQIGVLVELDLGDGIEIEREYGYRPETTAVAKS